MTGWQVRAIAIGVVALLLGAALFTAHRKGERAGADHVTVQVQRDHAAAVTLARQDERAAVDASATIATSVAQQTVAFAAVTHHIVEDLRNAIQSVPPAAAGDALPPAPVDSLRDTLNAGIDRANRAADAAEALR